MSPRAPSGKVNVAIAAAILLIRLSKWFSEKDRDAIWIGIIKSVLANAYRLQPTLDFFRRMLPSVLWIIPIEIDHIVRFKIECIIPITFDEVIVDQPLNVVSARGNAEDLDGLLQRDGRVQLRQLASHLSKASARLQTSFR